VDLSDAQARKLLELPLFRELDKRHRTSLIKFSQLRVFPAGTDFIRQGEYTSDFFVVLSGIVTAYYTDKDGRTEILDQFSENEWFGELSAISNQPAMARYKADLPCVLLLLDAGLFRELFQFSKGFKKAVDQLYRERSLARHLRVVPLLKDLDKDLLRTLRKHARFESHPKDTVIASQGQRVSDVILVRSGGLSMTRTGNDGRQQLAGYLMANSSCGEAGFLGEDAEWADTYTTLMITETLVLPIAALQEAFVDLPEVLEGLRASARLIAAEDQGIDTSFYAAEDLEGAHEQLEVMVHSESIKGGEALVIDLDKCVRCNACVESCVAVHDDRIPRLSKKGKRVSAAGNSMGKELSLTTSCYHCEDPGCMMACTYGAIRRDTLGLIRFVWDNCVGCAECVKGCPYDVIRLTAPPNPEAEVTQNWLGRIPLIGKWMPQSERAAPLSSAERGYHREQAVTGKAVKCDRCEGLPFEACVYNCPCGAIERITPALIFDSGLVEMATQISGSKE
jgi:CRP-like cAMP-binding protein/Fe-S-cluster-containing dehydrogenase component